MNETDYVRVKNLMILRSMVPMIDELTFGSTTGIHARDKRDLKDLVVTRIIDLEEMIDITQYVTEIARERKRGA